MIGCQTVNNFFNVSILRALVRIQDELDNPTSKDIEIFTEVRETTDLDGDYTNSKKLLIDYPGIIKTQLFKDTKLNILYSLIKNLKPDWEHTISISRNSLFEYFEDNKMNNIIQLFEYCELDTNGNSEVSKWWKSFYQNNYDDFSKTLIGIKGETLTIEYENAKLKEIGLVDLECSDKSIDEPSAGYDVLSYRSKNNQEYEIYIEAKYNSRGKLDFFFTKNEFKKLEESKNNYYIYLWCDTSTHSNNEETTKEGKASLYIYDYKFLKKVIPKDTLKAKWSEVIITPLIGDEISEN